MAAHDAPVIDCSGLPQVVAIGISKVPEGTTLARHELAHHELNYISDGRYRVELNGEPQVPEAGGVYAYRPGDVAEGVSRPGDGRLVCRWVKFSWPGARGVASPLAVARECPLDAGEQARLVAAFDRMLEIHAQADSAPGARLATAALLLEVLALVAKAGERGSEAPRRPDRRLTAGLAFMERHLARKLLISEVAAASGLAEDYFTRLFRRQLGIPPMQHLIRLRLQEARRLLIGQPMPVVEIARRCGFDDPGHFARLFRRHFGVAPREFRSRLAP